MIPYETYRGGSDTNGATALNPGDTLNLTDDKLWCHLDVPTNAGKASITLVRPFALGLPINTTFRLVFTAGSDHNTVIKNNVSLANQIIFDAGGTPTTVIDHSTLKWTDTTSIDAVLLDNTTGNGSWLLYSWGT